MLRIAFFLRSLGVILNTYTGWRHAAFLRQEPLHSTLFFPEKFDVVCAQPDFESHGLPS